MRLMLLGPPGAGKGTQATRIAAAYDVPHVSTGDIFRANVKDGTPLGREAKSYMDRGDLVPDEVVNKMVFDRLDQADAKAGYLLDGYPRTVPQAIELDAFLDDRGARLDAVLRFDVPEPELVARLLGRAEEQGRADDSEDVIRKRLQVYHEQTSPLEDYYAARGVLHDVEAVGEIDAITDRTLELLAGIGHPPAARNASA